QGLGGRRQDVFRILRVERSGERRTLFRSERRPEERPLQQNEKCPTQKFALHQGPEVHAARSQSPGLADWTGAGPLVENSRCQRPGLLVYRCAATNRNSESSLWRAQAPNPISTASPKQNQSPRKKPSPVPVTGRMMPSEMA